MKRLLLIGLMLFVPCLAAARPLLNRAASEPVTLDDGDRFSTAQLDVSSQTATLIVAADANYTRRRVRIQNTGNFVIYLASTAYNATSGLGWTLGESTNTTISPMLDTRNWGAVYGLCLPSTTVGRSCTSRTLIEYNSLP